MRHSPCLDGLYYGIFVLHVLGMQYQIRCCHLLSERYKFILCDVMYEKNVLASRSHGFV